MLFLPCIALSSQNSAYPSSYGDDKDSCGSDLKPLRREVYGNGKIFDITHRISSETRSWDSDDGVLELSNFSSSEPYLIVSNNWPVIDILVYLSQLEVNEVVEHSQGEIILVEGLKLDDVEAGIYNVHCLPLRLLGAEGSPIRCILIK
ncbi:cyclase-like protein 2 isoform X1 [Tanacetum coccineum]